MKLTKLINFLLEEEDYRGVHRAPGKTNGAPLWDVTKDVYPDDIYTLPMEEERPMVLYHGTLKDSVGSILSGGLKAGGGWGGAAKPGVFLSPTPEDASYWAKMTLLRKRGLPKDSQLFNELTDEDLSEIVILKIRIPVDEVDNVIERRMSFSLPNDLQYVGSIPPDWISVLT